MNIVQIMSMEQDELIKTQILNKEYVVRKIDYYGEKMGEDKNYFIKVFMDIYTDGLSEVVQIKGQLEKPESFEGYDYYNDYWILSNNEKIIFNDYMLNDYNCTIVDDKLNTTDNYYFIMEKTKFNFEYLSFVSKLYKLMDAGYSFNQIKFLFKEFTKVPIEIL